MFRRNYIVRINLPGGIVAAGLLYSIIEAAERAGVANMQIGNRQQLVCKVTASSGEAFLSDLRREGIFFEVNEDNFPNVVSSYVTQGILDLPGNVSWLSEGLYKDILELFDYAPRLKINLVEKNQSFVPFFSGNINFISSSVGNYWYLYVRPPQSTCVYAWKELIYSMDIPRISRFIEEALLVAKTGLARAGKGNEEDESALFELIYAEVSRKGPFATQRVAEAFRSPAFDLPYYEGFNRYGNKTWLGIYRREELFSLPFLKDICLISLQTRIGQLYTTPWKSLIIKGIEEKDRVLWEYVLGKYRINVRHASNELNWQVEDLSEEGLRLKRYLVRQFDLEDLRTDGLCFAIKTRPRSGLSGSLIIRKQEAGRPDQRKLLDRYDILHTPDFNANSREYIVYREGLEKEHLAVYLVSLCKHFYGLQLKKEPSGFPLPGGRQGGLPGSGAVGKAVKIFQCTHCLSLYDDAWGDEAAGVAPGVPFEKLDAGYCCSVCGNGKEGFRAVEKSTLVQG